VSAVTGGTIEVTLETGLTFERSTDGPADIVVGITHDLTQEALFRAYRKLDAFAPGTNRKAWLFNMTYSLFVNRNHVVAVERMWCP
jgi:hypothetical protein